MPPRCCVPKCPSVFVTGNEISFHCFPKNEEIRRCWLNALRIKKLRWKKPIVCSKHFNKDDFVFGANRPKLKRRAIPQIVCNTISVNVNPQIDCRGKKKDRDPEVTGITSNTISISKTKDDAKENTKENIVIEWREIPGTKTDLLAYTERQKTAIFTPTKISRKRKISQIGQPPTTINSSCVNKNVSIEEEQNQGNNEDCIKSKNEECQYESLLKTKKTLEDEIEYLKQKINRLQALKSPKPNFCVEKFSANDKKMLYYTGFQNYNIFLTVFKFILPSNNVSGRQEENFEELLSKVTPLNQFFLTLIRLKRGMCVETLADLFGLAKGTVDKIVSCWINLIYFRLSSIDMWPRDMLDKRTPAKKEKLNCNVIGSIACLEFNIQNSSSSSTTLKSLLMLEPAGRIIYASPMFRGQKSDKEIINKIGILKILKKKVDQKQILLRDIILANKGFNLADLFRNTNSPINIPVFRISGVQFSSEEVLQIQRIAQAGVHIEKAIRRLKSYRILSMKIPIESWETLQEIYTVCVMLSNFRYALIRENNL